MDNFLFRALIAAAGLWLAEVWLDGISFDSGTWLLASAIVAALAVMSFRSKRRLEHWLLLRPQVFALVNHLRRRSGHPPLLAP